MSEPEHTPDGRYVVIDGRRWRAADPDIPEARRAELTRVLMAWRREVRLTRGTDEEATSRAGVQAAKVALVSAAPRGGSRRRLNDGPAGVPGCRPRTASSLEPWPGRSGPT